MSAIQCKYQYPQMPSDIFFLFHFIPFLSLSLVSLLFSGQFLKVFVYDTTPAGGSGPVPEIPVTETPTIAPTDAPVVPPPTEATVEVAPVEEAPTDTMGDSSESMSGAASTNAVVSMAGLMGAALALVLL